MSQFSPVSVPSHFAADRTVTSTWSLVGANPGDVYIATGNPGSSDRSVQLSGDFSGSTIVIQGSNDGLTWYTLTDVSGAALSFTAIGIKQIEEMTNFVRPYVSVGTANNVQVVLLVKEAI